MMSVLSEAHPDRLKTRTKAALTRWPSVKSLAYVADDIGWGLRRRLGNIASDSGSTHTGVAVPESVAYVEEVVNDYRAYGGLDQLGGIAAEVGPGDNAGVALLLRAGGCDSVELVDRFRSRRSLDQQRRIYQALAARHGIEDLAGADGWDDEHLPGISWRLGSSAEDFFMARSRDGAPGYDLIVSRATLEHLYDPLGALRAMAACLRPGGRMVHKIDFRDHGMFTPAHPELTYLRFPTALHRQMTTRSGRPNRVLIHRYRDLAGELARTYGLAVTLLVTSMVGEGEIVPHAQLGDLPPDVVKRAVGRVDAQRQGFAREFTGVASEDLAVTGIFWVAVRSPASSPD